MAQVHNMKGGHFTTATPVHEIANELLGKICAVMSMPELFYFATSSKALYLSCKTYLEEPLKLRGMYRVFDLSGRFPVPGHAETL